ncbi:MAG: hypothetical protein CMH98_04450 [Oceanospirillaceae bacterium]|nr:hypothetical protein [Oceanospirillaceae bacterium]|tara:strand:- start:18136 stop:19044 length:909 start_codon:yes stop_codon:yes gene_type:complete
MPVLIQDNTQKHNNPDHDASVSTRLPTAQPGASGLYPDKVHPDHLTPSQLQKAAPKNTPPGLTSGIRISQPVAGADKPERGRIQALFNDVYWVAGDQPGQRGARQPNMIIIRDGHQLILINPVRLSPLQERNLEHLGRIAHIVRLGDRPSADEHHYRTRYRPKLWALPGQIDKPRHQILKEDAFLPVPGAQLVKFHYTCRSEAVLLLERHGLLLTSESFQFLGCWPQLTLREQLTMRLQGFHKGMNLSRHWLREVTPKDFSLADDLSRLRQLDFDSLLAAHGTPLLQGAKRAVDEEIQQVFH